MTTPSLKTLSAGAHKDLPVISPVLKTFSAGVFKYKPSFTPSLKTFSVGVFKYADWSPFMPSQTKPEFQQLQDLTKDLKEAITDPNTLRGTTATALNPLATLADTLAFLGFRAEKSTAQLTSGGSLTVSLYDTVKFNAGSGFNPTTGIFTVPAGGAGYYQFNASVGFDDLTLANQLSTQLLTSGGNEKFLMVNYMAGSETDPCAGASGLVQLAAGETARIFVTISAENKNVIYAAFSGYRVGV